MSAPLGIQKRWHDLPDMQLELNDEIDKKSSVPFTDEPNFLNRAGVNDMVI